MHRLSPAPGRGGAFSLIELLVVVAILGILAALLAPVLGRSKSAAARVRCVANLHQLGLAAQVYWDDHDGRAFRWRGGVTNGGQIFWFGWLGSGAEGTRRFDRTQGALHPYLGAGGVEICPAFDYVQPRLKLKATGASYGYGYDLALSAPPGGSPVNAGQLPDPAGLVLLGDAAQVNTFQFPASRSNPMLEEFYYLSPREATTHFRHSRSANAVFCDGHVGSEPPAPGSLDARLSKQQVGWLREEIVTIR